MKPAYPDEGLWLQSGQDECPGMLGKHYRHVCMQTILMCVILKVLLFRLQLEHQDQQHRRLAQLLHHHLRYLQDLQ